MLAPAGATPAPATLAPKLPKHAKKELDAYLDCGLLCRGFARLKCESCDESRLVAFACKGRGFCPSYWAGACAPPPPTSSSASCPRSTYASGCSLSAFAWRRRLAQDGALFSRLSRLFVETVSAFYAERGGGAGHKTGAVTVVQRTSSDLRLNPHLHVVFLGGTYAERDGELVWMPLGRLQTAEVGDLLERIVQRIDKHLRRRGLLQRNDDEADEEDTLAASAVSRQLASSGPA